MTKLLDHENTRFVTCQTKTVNTEIIVNNPRDCFSEARFNSRDRSDHE